MKTAVYESPLPSVNGTPATPTSWAKVAQKSACYRRKWSPATSCPTQKPTAWKAAPASSSPYLGVETSLPRSTSPSPQSLPMPTPPEDEYLAVPKEKEERIQTFCEQLTLQHASEPAQFIQPFCIEVHMHPDCPLHTKEDLGEIIKIVLGEIHVVSDKDYVFDGNVVLCYTVFPYDTTLAQVQRRNLGHDLAWKARMMRQTELASALTQAPIDLYPRDSTPSPSIPQVTRGDLRKHNSLPPEMDRRCSTSPYMEFMPSQSPYFEPQSSSNRDYLPSQTPYFEPQSSNNRDFQNLVQPAVNSLVNKTKKKKRTNGGGLPADFRARQNLVQLKHERALAVLKPWILDETKEKIYLRGENVSFIQVKCPKALHAVDDFLDRIVNDESIEIVHCTLPLSRKRQGQLKGYLIYLQCRTAANVARINEIFEKDFSKSGLKCKTARFEKSDSDSSLEQTSV